MRRPVSSCWYFFFFNDTATTEIYTLSLHDALPICSRTPPRWRRSNGAVWTCANRSEEHTSELQSRRDLVCRLLLEKKKTIDTRHYPKHKKIPYTLNQLKQLKV